MATAHPYQNARINTSVDNLDSCKKRAPKHKWFESNGELGIGTLKTMFGHLKSVIVTFLIISAVFTYFQVSF